MTRRRQWLILGALCALYLTGLGILVGIASERFRFDGIRNSLVRQLDDATKRARTGAMDWEREIQADAGSATPRIDARTTPTTWQGHMEAVNAALARRDVSAAERAWRDAYGVALRTRTWRPLADVGEAALRIAAVAGHREPYRMNARELYLAALTRARADRSVEGVVHVADLFDALGDQAVVQQCLIIAEGMAGTRDGEASRRLRALTNRVVDVRSVPTIEP